MRRLIGRIFSARRTPALFLAIVAGLAIWQVWLTWRLMEQERSLAAQRSRERVEQIADLALAQLNSALGTWDAGLRDFRAAPPPGGSLALAASGSAVTVKPARPLLFTPEAPAPDPIPDGAFAAAERLEFRDRNYAAAIEAMRPLAERPATRSEALLRIARLERRLGRDDAALAAYERLAGAAAIGSDGVPYALLAAGARCEMAPPTCGRLRKDLLAGRWSVRRETFEYYWSEANRPAGAPGEPPKEAVEFAARVADIYSRAGDAGREMAPDGSLAMWRRSQGGLAILLAPAGWLDAAFKLPANATDIRWRVGAKGRPLAEAQLPGRIEFYSVARAADEGSDRALRLAGVGLMLLLVLSGAYAMHRGVSRELQVARLQSDFVSAVSHEFRSPLTSLRGIAELLASGRLGDEERKRQSYVFLERETGRLQRLVEDLLDFGRMESGRKQYRMERRDAFGLVRAAVAEFREEAVGSGFEVELRLEGGAAPVMADEGALRRAVRNLLENAVKYSPGGRMVWVEGRIGGGRVEIAVRDEGMGVDPRERRDIFQKFVRGEAAKKAGIKGTGIGLSMVRQIVEACGGEIGLQSEVGAGSTFTIALPLDGGGETGT